MLENIRRDLPHRRSYIVQYLHLGKRLIDVRIWVALLVAMFMIAPCAVGHPLWAGSVSDHMVTIDHDHDLSTHRTSADCPHHSEHDNTLCQAACQKWLVTRPDEGFLKGLAWDSKPQPQPHPAVLGAISHLPIVVPLLKRQRAGPIGVATFDDVFARTGRLHL